MTTRQFVFAIDQSGGNAVYQANLAQALHAAPGVAATYHGVHIVADDIWQRLPGVRSNYALTASARAAWALHATRRRTGHVDAALIHSQSIALFSIPFMRRVPTVISSDGTPRNYDSYADGLEHRVYGPRVEGFKHRWTRATIRSAARLLGFSSWVRDSFINDYGADPERVVVIPPGIDTDLWVPRPEQRPDDGIVRILFTGGHFARKGGPLLLDWVRQTRHRNVEVHLVTQHLVPDTDRVVVHNGMRPNSPELIALAQSCDLFALPTRGDCFSFAGIEAQSVGMPVVISNVGGISEIITDGENGYLVERDDTVGLFERLDHLVENTGLRERMGRLGRERAVDRFTAKRNAGRVLDLLMKVADEGRAPRPRAGRAAPSALGGVGATAVQAAGAIKLGRTAASG
jgi:glycosyltransferase involved in cell wall biosynthesis